MEDMDLKGVELNVAVNAVIGSMVTHGYLGDLDNAILVTVSNDSIKKATVMSTSVVEDIEKTLQENQVKAVVYDQQVIEEDAVRKPPSFFPAPTAVLWPTAGICHKKGSGLPDSQADAWLLFPSYMV